MGFFYVPLLALVLELPLAAQLVVGLVECGLVLSVFELASAGGGHISVFRVRGRECMYKSMHVLEAGCGM